MENGTLVRVDCKPANYSNVDTFYVPSRPEEATLECVTNGSYAASLINVVSIYNSWDAQQFTPYFDCNKYKTEFITLFRDANARPTVDF